ncbi:site-2 protease family protein [Sinomonas sp. JGH33]|uniref:endopeptidase La n=1 Tax=Sinomonas terricola TaxID=3110330 RepID=A0ABU5T0M4_9MICC|nr:S16 family serine protease [Sinomonas sp. JGH33]MEA5453140.1 site-2 protease family protein [Sinomonas sp. JGH33]
MNSSVTPPDGAPERLPREGEGGGEPADDGGLPRLRRARRAPRTGRGTVAVVSGAAALALGAVVWSVPVPYIVERPGPVYNTLGSASGKDVISIQGRETYPAQGALDLTTVYVEGGPNSDVSLLGLVRAALDPTESITPVDTLYPKGVTRQQITQENTVEMQSSQDNAVAAALKDLSIPFTQRIKIAGLVDNSASAGKLEPQDVIVSVAGQPVDSLSTIQKLVASSQGRPIDVGFERGGTQHTVSITPRDAGQGRFLLGFTVTYAFTFPFAVEFALDKVGGPSAGMMFSLGIVDKLTPGDLTGGKQVAGTGTIDPTGAVGEIGGIVQKMNGARREGATLFLAPAGNCGEVVGHIPDGLAVVRVDTLDGARRAVDSYAHGADPASLPQCTKG